MERKKEVEVKKEKEKKQKILLSAVRRNIFRVIAIILFIGAVVVGIRFLPPKTSTVEVPEYVYQTLADISYRVKLLPSSLFNQELLEEGEMYSSRLTDQIEAEFNASFVGSSKEEVVGYYTITGVVEGYQELKDSKKTIYERRFPIKEGEVSGDEQGAAIIKEEVHVDVDPYRQMMDEAEAILGASPSRVFYLLFEGEFIVNSNYGEVKESFDLSLNIPIPKQDGFYEISKPEAFSKTDQIASKKEIVVPASPIHILLIIIWALLAVALFIWAQFFTRKPNEEEVYLLKWKEMFRKYGSRMIRLKDLDEKWEENEVEVSDIDNLIMISEEIHQPVCYSLDENGLPKSGILYVPTGQKRYVLYLKEANTTLVVE